MTSFLRSLSVRFRRGFIAVCQSAGVVLVLLASSMILVPLIVGLALLAVSHRVSRRDARNSRVIIVPA
ncbi:MAG: hypothetical protein EXS05_01770 [Planctomycetaceae bacterium]|nr:hypothetical protein [Planctomycetaceae bacterium]